MINKKYSNLINNFNLISQKKWIKSIVNNTSGVGLTFEYLLGKCKSQYKNVEKVENKNVVFL